MKSLFLLGISITSGFVYSSDSFPTRAQQALTNYRTVVACTNGGTRINGISHYISNSEGLGVYSKGALESKETKLFLGTSLFGDLMVVEPVYSPDKKIVGYNVYLELCEFESSYGVELIDDQRPITNLGIDVLELTNAISCEADMIAKSSVWLEVGALNEFYPTAFPTSFFPIDTNLENGSSACLDGKYSYWNPYYVVPITYSTINDSDAEEKESPIDGKGPESSTKQE